MSRRPRVFVAALFLETHTFLDGRTTWDDLSVTRREGLFRVRGDSSPTGGALEEAERCNWDVLPALLAVAPPGATVSDDVAERYWSELVLALDEYQSQAPLDAVFLVLHGAMTCESILDVEGMLLQRLRQRLQPSTLPVFGVYDLHANITATITDNANCLVAYRENPHFDARESSVRAVGLLDRALQTKQLPRMLFAQPPIVWPPTGTGTADEPMKSLEQLARKLEQQNPDFWVVNVTAGFAFADTPDTGVSFSVSTTGDDARARYALEQLCEMAVANAQAGNVVEPDVDDVLAALSRDEPGLTVLVEPSDNIGGGGPGDCTGLLRALIRHQFQNSAVCLCDALAVQTFTAHQPGDRITLALGGRGSRLDPGPLELNVELVRTCDGLFELVDKQSHLASMCGDRFDMGPCAVVRFEGITILLTTHRTPPMDLGQWRHVGCEPSEFSFVGVKAAVAHRRAWDTISKRNVWVSTPGPCSSDLSQFTYRNLRRPIFPLDPILK